MRLFFIPEKINKNIERKYLAEWVKPFYPYERLALYGLESCDIIKSQNPNDTDIFILPLTWNYYFEMNNIEFALSLIKEYTKFGKPIFTWAGGDFKLNIPSGDFFLLQNSCYSSKRRHLEYVYPSIIRDPFEYLKIESIRVLEKNSYPKIGFCGFADNSWINKVLNKAKSQIYRLNHKYNRPYIDLSVPLSGSSLRRLLINKIKNSENLEDNFIVRSSYGGQSKSNQQYKLEYWNNMLLSPYILCVRGAGNFSVRFYESLAMGRIPIFINTDSVLPFDNLINWEKHCVIIQEDEIDNLNKIILKFHNNLTHEKFYNIQYANRLLWKEMLTFNGFLRTFLKEIYLLNREQ